MSIDVSTLNQKQRGRLLSKLVGHLANARTLGADTGWVRKSYLDALEQAEVQAPRHAAMTEIKTAKKNLQHTKEGK